MEHEKDYSLLRPFDTEKAKAGEAICYKGGADANFIAEPNCHGVMPVQWNDGQFHLVVIDNIRMAPLCWVEGKPVYKGDVLFDRDGSKIVAENVAHNGAMIICCSSKWGIDLLTWTPPPPEEATAQPAKMVKKSGWFVVFVNAAFTEAEAKEIAGNRAALKAVRIEWEETEK